MRTAIRKVFEESGVEFIEVWVLFDGETSFGVDVRNPKRENVCSSNNVGTLFVKLPEANKGQRKVVARASFTKCGESTNFSGTYTGVPCRTLAEIQRLATGSKQQICGSSAVGEFCRERVRKEVEEKGHPLFWGEWKPGSLDLTLFADFEVTDVSDMTTA